MHPVFNEVLSVQATFYMWVPFILLLKVGNSSFKAISIIGDVTIAVCRCVVWGKVQPNWTFLSVFSAAPGTTFFSGENQLGIGYLFGLIFLNLTTIIENSKPLFTIFFKLDWEDLQIQHSWNFLDF